MEIKNKMNEEIEKLEQEKKEIEKKITLEGKKQKQAAITELVENFTKKRIESLNEKLISPKDLKVWHCYDGIINLNMPFIYSNQEILLNFRTKNKAFRKKIIDNKAKTIENLIFENGFIKSDHIFNTLRSFLDSYYFNLKTDDLIKEAKYEIAEVLIKNNETGILSGNVHYKDYTLDPNQYGSPLLAPIFKLNYLLDVVENEETKKDLKIIQERRMKEFLSNKKIINLEDFELTFILNKTSFNEVISRTDGKPFLISAGMNSGDIPSEYEQDYEKLKQDVTKTLLEGQKEILTYMSKNPKIYIALIKKLANCKVENE